MTLTVTFDRPLVPGVYNHLSWTQREANQRRLATAVQVFPGSPLDLVAITAFSGPDAGPNVCFYLPAAPDVIGQNGKLVLPFSDFPVT